MYQKPEKSEGREMAKKEGHDVAKKEQRALPRVRPATDILERTDGFHIYMDLPGASKESLHIDLNENELNIRAESAVKPREGAKDLHMEFGGVEYFRNFTISDVVDREKINASLKNGVLELFLPKAEKAKPKRIEIKSA
ncbi:MAG: Hsp20/alpha crystallin family protein [Desulfovibrionales bacterium]